MQHLGDIEAAVRHVAQRLDPVLWREIGKLVEKKFDQLGWRGESDPDDTTFWLTPDPWMTPEEHRGSGDEDAWFAIEPVFGSSEEEADATSLAGFTGASAFGNRMVLCFKQQVVTTRPFRAALGAMSVEVLGQIRALGFEIDQREMRIALPLKLDARSVGQALVDNAFEDALAPIAQAIDTAVAAVPLLEHLVAKVREKR